MADKNEYPLRRTLPEPVAVAPGEELPAGSSRMEVIGRSINEALKRAGHDAMNAGSQALGVAAPIPAFIAKALSVQPARVAAMDLANGVAGVEPRVIKPVAPAAAPTDTSKAVTLAAMAPGMAAPAAPTTRQLQDAFVQTLFSGPLSMREARDATGMMQADKSKPPTFKDLQMAELAKESKTMLEDAVKAASAETDPEKRQLMTAKAMDDNYKRGLAGIGFNPMDQALAAMLGGAQLEEQ